MSSQVHLVAAGITLCLDHLHHWDNKPSFTESRKLVDRAIRFLKTDDSTLSSRGVQLLSTLLTGGKPGPTTPIPCPIHELPCQGHGESSRPPDVTPGLDPSWVQRQVNDTFACPHVESTSTLAHDNLTPQIIAPAMNSSNMGISDQIPPTAYQHSSFTIDSQEFDGNILAPDMSFFDLFSEYYPALSGFDNLAVFEDLFH